MSPSKPTPSSVPQTGAASAARNTDSAGAQLPPGQPADALALKAAHTQALVASMPANTNKGLEHGHDNALNPPVGLTSEPASPAATGSTLSEEVPSNPPARRRSHY